MKIFKTMKYIGLSTKALFMRRIYLSFLTVSVLILSISTYSVEAKGIGVIQCGGYAQDSGVKTDKTSILRATIEPYNSGYLLKVVMKGGEKVTVTLTNRLVRVKTPNGRGRFNDYDDPITVKKDGSFSFDDRHVRFACTYTGKLEFINGAKERIFR
jgi:hypothetical protein